MYLIEDEKRERMSDILLEAAEEFAKRAATAEEVEALAAVAQAFANLRFIGS